MAVFGAPIAHGNDPERAIRAAFDKAELAASRDNLTSELAQLHYLRGNLYFPLGNLDGCLEQHQLALDFARQVGSTESEALALSGLGDAKHHLEIGMRLADELGATRFEAFFLIYFIRIARIEDGENTRALVMINKAADDSREMGITFLGPWVLSTLALLDDDPASRKKALDEGEKILGEGCVGHNYFAFYRDAMEVALAERDWAGLNRFAASLEDYGLPEPLPLADYFIARDRALATHGLGQRDAATMTELRRLRDEADRIGFKNALPALDEALAVA